MLLGLTLAAVVGLSLGLLGGGGSILAVPIFVYVMGFSAKEAIAMSLGVVGLTSLFGAVRHWRAGNVDVPVAVLFGFVAMGGTYLGARLASLVSGSFQLILFAAVMAVAAFFMFREGVPLLDRMAGDTTGRPGAATDTARADGPGERRKPVGRARSKKHVRLALIVAEGVGVGVLTGLVGVGGGFLIVPALVLLGGVDMKKAVGTSLLVIAMKSATGFVGYLDQVEVAWAFMGWFSAMAVAGILAGASLVPRVPQRVLRKSFAGFLVLMASVILYQNRGAFAMEPPRDEGPAQTVESTVVRARSERPPVGTLRTSPTVASTGVASR